MKILFLAQRVPYPPNKGDKLRSFNEIKYLSQRHQISLVCLADSAAETLHDIELLRYCESVDIVVRPSLPSRLRALAALLGSKPLTLAYFFSARLRDIVSRKLAKESFDLIVVYCSSMAQYVEDVRHIPTVIDFVDLDSEKWRQYALASRFPMNRIYALESGRLREYERVIAERFCHCFFVSAQEVFDFRKLVHGSAPVTAIPNGVDFTLFKPTREPYTSHTLVFTGAMDYFANVDAVLFFVQEILPIIRQAVPDCTFTVVGGNPAPSVRALPGKYPEVFVTGAVESVVACVTAAAVFVAPMRIARGVQNKILEAMAMGVPVVTTPLGLEGITAQAGDDLLVAEGPELFAGEVIRLLTDPELRQKHALNGRRFVEEQCQWSKYLDILENVINEVVPDSKVDYFH